MTETARTPKTFAVEARCGGVMTAEAIARMPAGPDKAEVMAFRTFLSHHPRPIPGKVGGAICDCGVPGRLIDGRGYAVSNPNCECPCHIAGYAFQEAAT